MTESRTISLRMAQYNNIAGKHKKNSGKPVVLKHGAPQELNFFGRLVKSIRELGHSHKRQAENTRVMEDFKSNLKIGRSNAEQFYIDNHFNTLNNFLWNSNRSFSVLDVKSAIDTVKRLEENAPRSEQNALIHNHQQKINRIAEKRERLVQKFRQQMLNHEKEKGVLVNTQNQERINWEIKLLNFDKREQEINHQREKIDNLVKTQEQEIIDLEQKKDKLVETKALVINNFQEKLIQFLPEKQEISDPQQEKDKLVQTQEQKITNLQQKSQLVQTQEQKIKSLGNELHMITQQVKNEWARSKEYSALIVQRDSKKHEIFNAKISHRFMLGDLEREILYVRVNQHKQEEREQKSLDAILLPCRQALQQHTTEMNKLDQEKEEVVRQIMEENNPQKLLEQENQLKKDVDDLRQEKDQQSKKREIDDAALQQKRDQLFSQYEKDMADLQQQHDQLLIQQKEKLTEVVAKEMTELLAKEKADLLGKRI